MGSGKRRTRFHLPIYRMTLTKPNPKPRIASAKGRSQAASAAPTLRYGPAGDSAPRLRLKAAWERGERPAFGEGPLPSRL